MVLGVAITVIAALIIMIVSGVVWMRKAIADQKAAHELLVQRFKYSEGKLEKIENTHDDQYHELGNKMDQTLAVLTDIKLAFSEVRIKNQSNEKRIDRLEEKK